jgi:hypothetical protein
MFLRRITKSLKEPLFNRKDQDSRVKTHPPKRIQTNISRLLEVLIILNKVLELMQTQFQTKDHRLVEFKTQQIHFNREVYNS